MKKEFQADSVPGIPPQTFKRATFFTVLSIVIGLVYYLYLTKVAFPHALARIVPFVWLGGSILGLSFGMQTLRTQRIRSLGSLLVAICFLSASFAAIFSFAALMGD